MRSRGSIGAHHTLHIARNLVHFLGPGRRCDIDIGAHTATIGAVISLTLG